MGKFANWLQIIGNFAIVGGLVMVGIQISQNTQFHRADAARRAQEQLMQLNIAVMGENPATALAKAAINPKELTDEELLVVDAYSKWWVQNDVKTQLVMDLELSAISLDQMEVFLKSRAQNQHGANPVAAAIWRDWVDGAPGELREWEKIVDREFQSIDEYNQDALYLRYLREAAIGD